MKQKESSGSISGPIIALLILVNGIILKDNFINPEANYTLLIISGLLLLTGLLTSVFRKS